MVSNFIGGHTSLTHKLQHTKMRPRETKKKNTLMTQFGTGKNITSRRLGF